MSYPDQVRFWRTSDGHEIDFVITSDFSTGKAVEVKFVDMNKTTYAFSKFAGHYPNIKLEIINHKQAAFL